MNVNDDNHDWNEVKHEINSLDHGKSKELIIYRYQDYKIRYLLVLMKLGYVERKINKTTNVKEYKKIKHIPNKLKWMDAQRMAKSLNIELNKGKRDGGLWKEVTDKIINNKTPEFCKYVLFKNRYHKYGSVDISHYPTLENYLNLLSKLEYIEKIDKNGNYIILKKIPDDLTITKSLSYINDESYKRQFKLLKIMEKINDRRKDI